MSQPGSAVNTLRCERCRGTKLDPGGGGTAVRPDQLDQWCSMAVNQIRRETNGARRRLGIELVVYDEQLAT